MRPSAPRYPLMQFAKRLGAILDDHPDPQNVIARRLGVSPSAITDYRKGRILPEDEPGIHRIAEAVAPGDEKVAGELVECAWLDYWDYQVRRTGQTVGEVGRMLKKIGQLRGRG